MRPVNIVAGGAPANSAAEPTPAYVKSSLVIDLNSTTKSGRKPTFLSDTDDQGPPSANVSSPRSTQDKRDVVTADERVAKLYMEEKTPKNEEKPFDVEFTADRVTLRDWNPVRRQTWPKLALLSF